MMHYSFFRNFKFEPGVYAIVGDIHSCKFISDLGLILGDLHNDVATYQHPEREDVKFVQSVDVRSARVANTNRYDGVFAFNCSAASIGHVKALAKPDGFLIHTHIGSRDWNAVKGELIK